MITNAFAMASSGAGAPTAGGAGSSFFVPMIIIFFIFYFIVIRPQKKREVSHRKFLEELKKGDEVITQSGFMGRVAGVTDSVVTLDMGQNVKLKVLKSAIAGNNAADAQKGTQ